MTYKAAVIGDRQTILGFRALGLTAVEAADGQQAAKELHRLAKERYAIIYITEQLAAQMPEAIARYIEVPEVAVIPIPSKGGTLGIGEREMHQAVERAVGADIFRDEE